nr:MAG: hypothetical protein DIU68_16600 [Chloroflexota bacterium]
MAVTGRLILSGPVVLEKTLGPTVCRYLLVTSPSHATVTGPGLSRNFGKSASLQLEWMVMFADASESVIDSGASSRDRIF